MQIRLGNKMLVLPALLGLFACVPLLAQQPDAAAGSPAASQVPPEVSQKAREYKGAATPPKNLVKTADGHWTPYAPPTVPEGATAYVIQAGDTLSQIAKTKLGNWLLWPQIWDANPYIKDAHWIYPGDPLFIQIPQLVGGEEVGLQEDAAAKRAKFELDVDSPIPPVNAHDIYCSGFIASGYVLPKLRIVSGPNQIKESLAQGDVVYLNGGTAEGVETGAEYFIIEPGKVVHHPESGQSIGNLYLRVGRVKVLTAQDHTSIAQIVFSCDEIRYGFALAPYAPIPIPWNISQAPGLPLYLPESQLPRGSVIWAEDRLESMGTHNIIYINLGSNHKLAPGDKLWIFRYPAQEDSLVKKTDDLFREQKFEVLPNDLFREQKDQQKAAKSDDRLPEGSFGGDSPAPATVSNGGDTRLPSGVQATSQTTSGYRKFLAEAVVLTTQPNTACVKIIQSAEEVHPGDWVQAE